MQRDMADVYLFGAKAARHHKLVETIKWSSAECGADQHGNVMLGTLSHKRIPTFFFFF